MKLRKCAIIILLRLKQYQYKGGRDSMSASIDFSEIREMTIAFSGLSHMDNEYTFFYDETNNSRLFRITETDFNVSKDEDFVLGGFVYDGNKAFDMEKLLQSLRLQPTMKEVKRKHIAPGNSFLECVNSQKLQTLLEWIIENKIYIHFMAMNNLYYGVVNIVDSLIAYTELSGLPWEYITHMKNALYKYINADIVYIHEVFLHYGYPNIADENVHEFCEVLIGWIEEIEAENEADDFALESVRQLLKSARKKKKLCFLTDNENLMLMDGYESFYIEPIYMFPNSEHIFDEETEIMKKICSTPIILGGNELHNFSFVKSTENRMVQLSDVIIGIIGKLMLYANVSTLPEIKKEMASLSPQQEKNVSLLNNLINASSDHFLAFIHYTANFLEMEKVTCIFTLPFRQFCAIIIFINSSNIQWRPTMRFTELLNRLTGISCPVFGVSWNPVDTERSIARRIIIFLEPRRVLYSAYDYESVCPCITSVTEIKNYLTSELQNIDEQSELNAYVRSMRNACNKFLSKCPDKKEFRCYACQPGNIDNWIFTSAIGELRGVFGVMIGQIAKVYGLDVEDDLAQIIPE